MAIFKLALTVHVSVGSTVYVYPGQPIKGRISLGGTSDASVQFSWINSCKVYPGY